MVTDSTQKLCCDGEVLWGQLPPLSEGNNTSRPLKGKREATGTCRGPIQHTCMHSAVPRHPSRQGFTCVYLGEEANISGKYVAWNSFPRSYCVEAVTDKMRLFM